MGPPLFVPAGLKGFRSSCTANPAAFCGLLLATRLRSTSACRLAACPGAYLCSAGDVLSGNKVNKP
jgi:hypothetical protein